VPNETYVKFLGYAPARKMRPCNWRVRKDSCSWSLRLDTDLGETL